MSPATLPAGSRSTYRSATSVSVHVMLHIRASRRRGPNSVDDASYNDGQRPHDSAADQNQQRDRRDTCRPEKAESSSEHLQSSPAGAQEADPWNFRPIFAFVLIR